MTLKGTAALEAACAPAAAGCSGTCLVQCCDPQRRPTARPRAGVREGRALRRLRRQRVSRAVMSLCFYSNTPASCLFHAYLFHSFSVWILLLYYLACRHAAPLLCTALPNAAALYIDVCISLCVLGSRSMHVLNSHVATDAVGTSRLHCAHAGLSKQALLPVQEVRCAFSRGLASSA